MEEPEKETKKEEEPKLTEPVAKEEPTPTPEPVVEEPAAVPYAEEQGFTFVNETSFRFPAYGKVLQYDEDWNPTGVASPDMAWCESSDCQYTIRPITQSEPDENGNVRVTIPIDTEYQDTCYKKDMKGKYGTDTHWRMFRLFDYYTGTQIVIPNDKLTYDQEPLYTELEWDGKTTRVGVSSYEDVLSYPWKDEGKTDDGFTKYTARQRAFRAYEITMPKDYDGLMLVGYREGSTEALYGAKPIDDGTGRSVLGPDVYNQTYTKDDLVFIRVTDQIKQSVPNDYIRQHNIAMFYSGLETDAELMKIKNEKDTDEMLYMPTVCEVSETTEDCEPGMKKVIGYYTIDYSAEGNVAFEAWVDAFDRYTGTSFMSGAPLTINSKTKATELEEPITIDTPSGPKQIFMEVLSKMDKKNKLMTRTITVTCPEDYDGTVFMVGYSSRALAEKLDFEKMASTKMTIDQMPFLQSGKNCFFYTLNGY